MADAGGGGNVNDFDVADVTSRLPLANVQRSRFIRLSHTLGLIYSPRPTGLAFTHLLLRDHFAFRQALKALTKGDDSERDSAAWALWQIPDKRAVPLLVQTLSDPYRYARGSAAGALGIIGDPRAVEPLTKLLNDTTPVHSMYGDTIGAVASWAIARIRSQRTN